MFSHLNFLSNFLMGAWLSWNPLAQICAAAPLMLLLMVQYAPESLNYLVYSITDAKNTFQWLKGNELGRRPLLMTSGITMSFRLSALNSLFFIERLLIFEIMAVWTTCPYYVFSCFSVHSPVSRPLLGKLNPLEFGLRDIFYYNI